MSAPTEFERFLVGQSFVNAHTDALDGVGITAVTVTIHAVTFQMDTDTDARKVAAADQHPMQRTVTGYTRPQHVRDHWQGNRPTDCAHCDRETAPNPDTTRRPVEPTRPGPFAGVLLVLLFWAALGSAAWAVMGPPLSGRHLALALVVGAFLFTAHRTARRNP